MKEVHRGISPQLNSSSNSVVTKPVGESKHIKRTQQIKALHNEFEALKKKIKDVQSKNEKIIENIHKQYDFKKKPQTTNFMIEADPVVHYDEQIQGSIPSIQNKNHHSDSENEFKGRAMVKKTSNIKKNQQAAFHQSIEYRKAQNHTEQRDQSQISSMKNNSRAIGPNQFSYSANSQYLIPQQMGPQQQFQISQFSGMNPYQQYSMQFPVYNNPNLAMSQVGPYYGNPNHSYQVEETLMRQRQRIKILQEELKALKKTKEKSMEYYEDMLEPHFVDFINDSMVKRFTEMEKYIKKNENKVKKIQLKLKDFRQAQMSRRIIQQHRSKRSHSRSKRQNSPRTNYNSLTNVPRIPNKKASQSLVAPNQATKSKQSQQSKSSQQFQEIANQYQEIIKIKTKELQAYEQRLRQKEREILQLSAKCSKLQMKISQLNESSKLKRTRVSQRQENLLSNLDFGNEKQSQILALNKKINQLQVQLQQKTKQIQTRDLNLEKSNKKLQQYESKTKKNELDMNKLKQQLKKFQKDSKSLSNLNTSLKKLQIQLQTKDNEYITLREKCSRFQNDKIQKQCENLTLSNKIKKIQSVLMVKQQKILQLEKIIQSSVGGNEGGDLLEKSMYLEKIDHNDLQSLQLEKDELEEQLVEQREQIFFLQKDNETMQKKCRQIQQQCNNLKKDVQNLQIQNESMKINLKAQQFQKYKTQISNNPLQKLLQQGDCVSQNEQDEHLLRQQLQQVKKKYQQTQILLKSLNQKSFQQNRKVLKLTSELNYFKQQLSDREDRYEKLRKQYEQVKCQINSLQQNIQERDSELEVQRKINSQKLKQIENQWLQFEQEVRNKQIQQNSHDVSDLRNSHHFSEESFVNYRTNYTSVNAENQRLMEKLKQTEKIIEVQKQMQEKIVKEYRSNVQRIKTELREKIKQNERLMQESQTSKRRIRVLEQNQVRLKQIAKGGEDENLLDGSNQRVVELELQLNQMREINNKLQAMQQELFNQISQKDKEIQSILRNLTNRQKRIEELEDIIELKQMNFSSHISTSQHKSKIRQSLQSQSSLRYSMLSNTQNPRDKTMQLELSEAGESFFDQNQSMVSNVSEVFGRQQFPYEKMQLKRVQQRKLFEKTAAYIKSLKKAIDQKNKKIKILEKKIESLRNSQLIRKDIYQIKQVQSFDDDLQPDNDDIFKDYYSVQLQRSHSQRYRIKQLQHETKLTIEQNNLLNNQIERIQEDLLRSEEQQNSLIKMKDLYKEEIKNILKQNQDQAKLFEEEMKKMRGKLEQSQSVQKMQALKQIYIKIVQCLVAFEAQSSKSKRKQQRRKQLLDFLKVCANLLNYDQSTRQKLLSQIISIKSQKR